MSANAGAVFAGVGQDLVSGTILSAVSGTPLPAHDSTFFEATLDAAFKDGGYVGENGVTISQNRSTQDIVDMDGTVVDTVLTQFSGTLATTFLELNEVTLKRLFGETNVTVTASTTSAGTRHAVVIEGQDLEPASYVFRMKNGLRRAGIIVPKARLADVGDIAFTNSGAASVDATLKCIPYWDTALAKPIQFYLILDDGVWAVSLVPTILSALPSAVVATGLVTIRGTRFTGAVSTTGVKFGVTNATAFTVVSDEIIVAEMPTGSAGAANITVTNASGTSSAFAYTRGA